MGDIIEDSPGPHAALDFATPLDLWVSCWGLPMDFVRLANFSTQEVLPLRLDSEGQVSEKGMYWAVHSDLLSEEVIGFWTEASHDVSSKGEIHRCAQNLCFLAKSTNNGGNRRLDFAELFSPPRVSPLAQQMGLKVDASAVFDLTAGWDVRNKEHRRRFRTFQNERRPKTLMASPECKAFSPLQNINKERMDPEYLRKILTEGQLMWNYSLEAVNTQTVNDDYFGLEHPERASSWKLPQTQRLLRRPDVAVIIFDQCALGSHGSSRWHALTEDHQDCHQQPMASEETATGPMRWRAPSSTAHWWSPSTSSRISTSFMPVHCRERS